MEHKKLFMTASDVSIVNEPEQQPNRIFVLIRMRMFSTRPNRNGEGVTERFIDEIVENQDRYRGLPQYVDDRRLVAHVYNKLGHMLDKSTGQFGTIQVGSMWSFEKVNDEYGVSLYGEARIPRREDNICQCIIDLYNMNMLNFSFEISYSIEDVVVENDVMYIDASECNVLTGMAIVTVPAYEESTALSQVAEVHDDDNDKDDKDDDDLGDGHDDDLPEEQGVDKKMTLEEAMNLVAEKDQKITQLSEELNVAKAETDAEKVDKEKALTDLSAANDEIKDKDGCIASKDAAIAEKDARIAELETQVAELEKDHNELNAMKAEKAAAELAEKQNKARSFAERQGLDVENADVAKAISDLNYEALASMSMDNEKHEEPKVTIAGFGADIHVGDKYGDLLASR